MNHRRFATAATRGEPEDHIAFIARMDLWHSCHSSRGTLPAACRDNSLWKLQIGLGIAILGFGIQGESFYWLEHHGVEVVRESEVGTLVTEYRTPHGPGRAKWPFGAGRFHCQ